MNGEVGGGGVSIYYSHTLQLLCFSYAQGKSFLAPLSSIGRLKVIRKNQYKVSFCFHFLAENFLNFLI